MFNNRTSIREIIGNLSNDEIDAEFQKISENIKNSEFDPDIERSKTETEIRAIRLANQATNAALKNYGLDEFDVSPDSIRIIDNEEMCDNLFASDSPGNFIPQLQMILIRDKWEMFDFGPEEEKTFCQKETFIHEMIHFKGWNSLQKTIGAEQEVTDYQMGIRTAARGGKKRIFTNLNEGITQELTKRIMKELLETDFLTDAEKDYAKTECHVSYVSETGIVKYLADVISKNNPEEYADSDKVFDFFAKAMLIGNVREVIRIIDKNFGPGTVRQMEEMEDAQEQLEFLMSLKKRKL